MVLLAKKKPLVDDRGGGETSVPSELNGNRFGRCSNFIGELEDGELQNFNFRFRTDAVLLLFGVYQNKCVNGIYKKLKNKLVAEPVGPVKNGFLFFTSP